MPPAVAAHEALPWMLLLPPPGHSRAGAGACTGLNVTIVPRSMKAYSAALSNTMYQLIGLSIAPLRTVRTHPWFSMVRNLTGISYSVRACRHTAPLAPTGANMQPAPHNTQHAAATMQRVARNGYCAICEKRIASPRRGIAVSRSASSAFGARGLYCGWAYSLR